MKNLVIATVGLLAFSQVSHAEIIIGGLLAGIPTTGKPGFATFTLTASSDEGKIVGFNFDMSLPGGGDSGLGIRGPMAQENPFGVATVFNDVPDALWNAAGLDATQDSHFLAKSAQGLVVNAFEDGCILSAAFNYNSGLGAASIPFAQVVVPNGARISFKGDFTIAVPGGYKIVHVVGIPSLDPCIPEPDANCLAAMSLVGLVLRRRY